MIASVLFSGLLHGATEPAPLRVLTFNLRYINSGDTGNRTWTSRRDQVGAVVAKDNADIIGIQEGFRSMLDDLEARAPGYVESGGGREDGMAKGEYSALLVKADRFTVQQSGTFWLSDTPEVVGSKTWGNQVVRICTWAKLYDRGNKRSIHVFNTHLDHQTPLARQKGTELILERCGSSAVSTVRFPVLEAEGPPDARHLGGEATALLADEKGWFLHRLPLEVFRKLAGEEGE